MRTTHFLIGILAFSLFSTSCVRKTDVIEPARKPDAGVGGFTTLRVSPQHHNKGIDSCTIYIKYNATTMPDNMVYDDSSKVHYEDGRSLAKFSSLKKGDYYIYGIGYDPDVAKTVTGGTYFAIADTLENNYDIYLALKASKE